MSPVTLSLKDERDDAALDFGDYDNDDFGAGQQENGLLNFDYTSSLIECASSFLLF